MRRTVLSTSALACVLCQTAFGAVQFGQTIKHIADPPPEIQRGLRHNGAIGFSYFRIGMLGIDVWTAGGEYCIYTETFSQPLSREQAAGLLGKETAQLKNPLTYTFPPGLLIIVAVVIGAIGYKFLATRLARRTRALSTDDRYRHALKIIADRAALEQHDPPEVRASSNEPVTGFDSAVEHLCNRGVSRHAARRNLRRLLAGRRIDASPDFLE